MTLALVPPTDAMAAAFAAIDLKFGSGAEQRHRKERIRSLLLLAPGHPAVRARYGGRMSLLHGRTLNGAITAVEAAFQAERKAFQITAGLGGGIRLSVEILAELRLILRLMRAKHIYALAGVA
jgi:hypothetical protein